MLHLLVCIFGPNSHSLLGFCFLAESDFKSYAQPLRSYSNTAGWSIKLRLCSWVSFCMCRRGRYIYLAMNVASPRQWLSRQWSELAELPKRI